MNLALENQDVDITLGEYLESNDKKGKVAKNGKDTDLKLFNIKYETGKWGLGSIFSGSQSYGQVDDSKYFDFPRDYDFAIAMWVKIPLSQSYTTNSSNFIIGKNGNGFSTINENLGGENSENQPDHILNQVKVLNQMVLDYAVQKIITGLKQHLDYVDHISNKREILPHSVNISNKGSKQLMIKPWF